MSPIRDDGTARPGTADIDGIILAQARRRKERTYPELVGRRSRARPCGLGWRGRRQVVGGDADVPRHLGTRESPLRAADPEEESRAGLEDALGRNPGVQRCSRVCGL